MVAGNETHATVRGAAVRVGHVEHASAQLQPAGDRLDSGCRLADGVNGVDEESRRLGDIRQAGAHASAAQPAGGVTHAHGSAAGRGIAEEAAEVQESGSDHGAGHGDSRVDAQALPRGRRWWLRGHDCLTAAVVQSRNFTEWFPARAVTGLRLWMAVFVAWLYAAFVYGFAASVFAWGVIALAVAVAVFWASYPRGATSNGVEPPVQSGQLSVTGDPEAMAAMPRSGKQGRKSRSKKVQREELLRVRWSGVLEMLVEQGFAGRAAKWRYECDRLQNRVKELEEKLHAERHQRAGDSIAQARKREESNRRHVQEVLRLKHAWSAQLAQVRREAIEVALEQVQKELTKLPE